MIVIETLYSFITVGASQQKEQRCRILIPSRLTVSIPHNPA
jgi:hypothetical protein